MKKVLTFLTVGVLCFQFAKAQEITSHQYRRVAPQDMQEYLKRETTYWSKFAESEITKGNLTFWAILQRVGGVDQETSPNILIINTFKDVDKGADWASVTDLFPDVKMEDIQTNTLSTNTDMVFLRDLGNHTRGANVVPENDFKYVRIIYHNTKDSGKHLTFEAEKWKPMLEKAMADGKTTMKGWGNAVVILPESDDFPYSSMSYDLFATAHGALAPAFNSDMEVPDGFFTPLAENYNGPRNAHLYRIVAVRTAPEDMTSK